MTANSNGGPAIRPGATERVAFSCNRLVRSLSRLSNVDRFMILHYRGTNYNPQIAFGVYSVGTAHFRAYVRTRELREVEREKESFISSNAAEQCCARVVPRCASACACVLFKHMSVETIMYDVSKESNLLARYARVLALAPRDGKSEIRESSESG